MKKVFVCFTLFMLLCGNLMGCAAMIAPTPEESAKFDYGPYPENYEQIIKDYLELRLIDPESARYKFLSEPTQGWQQEPPLAGGGRYIGWTGRFYLNSKNRFGGYTGADEYIYIIYNNQVIYCKPAALSISAN